jgi:hypothetical protein
MGRKAPLSRPVGLACGSPTHHAHSDAWCELSALGEVAATLASIKGEAMNWLRDPSYAALRLRLENAHAAVEAAMVEARRRVRLNEGRER